MTPTDIDRIEANVEHLATATARLARQMGLYKTAAELTAQVYGPDCALCGEPCHNSFRTDTNVHAECWRREKAG